MWRMHAVWRWPVTVPKFCVAILVFRSSAASGAHVAIGVCRGGCRSPAAIGAHVATDVKICCS